MPRRKPTGFQQVYLVPSSIKESMTVADGIFNGSNATISSHTLMEFLKAGEQNPEASMLDSVKSDECMESAEIKNIDMDAIPRAGFPLIVEPKQCQNLRENVTEIHKPKHQGFSSSVAENTCSEKDVDDDEIMSYKKKSTQLNDDNSADLSHLNSPSRAICTVCNIFSSSQADLEKHLAGKKHSSKVKYLNSLMSSSASI